MYSLSKKTAQFLRHQILEEELYPSGSRIPSERLLAEKFNVSRPVIREAIRILASEGLLTTIHGSGTFVRDVHEKFEDPLHFGNLIHRQHLLQEWYEARCTVETEIVKLAVDNATEQDLLMIEKALIKVEELIKAKDGDFLMADRNFHLTIARATKHHVYYKLIYSLQESMFYTIAENQQLIWHQNARSNALYHHRKIYEAICQRDELSTVMAMRSHMNTAKQDLNLPPDTHFLPII